MAEATLYQNENGLDITAAAAYSAGEVIQLSDGAAGIVSRTIASGDRASPLREGVFKVAKTASQVWIDGGPIWWDHSANSATCVPPLVAGDRDFYLGTAVGNASSSATEGYVNLNNRPVYEIDLQRDGGDVAVVKTAGTPYVYSLGGSLEAGFSATAEAQKLDWLSKRSFALGSNWVLEAVVEVVTNADADVADLSIGVANATHASDADSITESCFIHLDMGADLNIDAESDDGTTEVAATDTTVDFAVGTPFYIVIDGRDPSDIQIYINGVNVLPDSVFTLAAATGPLKALFHLEKSSNDSPGVVQLDALRVRTMQQ